MFLILFMLQITFFLFCSEENTSVVEKNIIPNLTFKNFDNKKVQLEQFYQDGPILINFWTLSCEPCKKEMKHLSRLNTKYSDYGFEVLSVNMDSPRTIKKVKQFTKAQKYTFEILSDPRMELFRKLGGSVMPLVVIVNKDGSILKKHIGYNPGDELILEKEIMDLLSLNSSDSEIQSLDSIEDYEKNNE